ncbi:MAG: hypothetical protein NTY34_02010 [Candidatus Omnitrophica bacterium]|nr:hypothetical protein [Candidatus Omnitrophota bacterium]
MAESISPEERLFRVIQEQKNSPLPKRAGKKARLGLREFKLFFTNLIPGKAVTAHPAGLLKFPTPALNISDINLRTVNKALAAIVAVLAILVFYNWAFGGRSVSEIVDSFSKIKYQAIQRKGVESLKPLNAYTEQVRRRDIFKPAPSRQGAAAAGSTLQALIKDLSLVGIYQGKEPEAMVEDKPAKKVYYLNKGGQIKGMTVKDILKDRIILQYGNDEAELL